jgi:voltage-gated potassium channel
MDERSARVQRRFELPILLAALLVVPVLIVQEADVGEPLETIADLLDWGIWLAFAAELVVMLAVVPRRWEWLREHPVDVAIVVLTPPVLPLGLEAVRLLRLLRLIRLAAVGRYAKQAFSLEGLRYAAIVAILVTIAAGAAFAALEKDQHLSMWDGVWWAVGTMTTLGSGIQPTDTAGRILAMAVVFVGIGFVALLTAAVAERFLAPEIEEEIEELEAEAEAGSDALLVEIREIMDRLRRLEDRVQRLGDTP